MKKRGRVEDVERKNEANMMRKVRGKTMNVVGLGLRRLDGVSCPAAGEISSYAKAATRIDRQRGKSELYSSRYLLDYVWL